ncbi:MAG: hypothetical protein JO057_08115 [Chloroflexi bacterium]|nr:hypothetical protein [Chloroflexota bacterium]
MAWLVEVWKAYAHRAGSYQTRVMLTLVYLVVLGPATFVARLFGARLMDLSPTGGSTWIARSNAEDSPESEKSLTALRRQF